jgi:hypothetical protein
MASKDQSFYNEYEQSIFENTESVKFPIARQKTDTMLDDFVKKELISNDFDVKKQYEIYIKGKNITFNQEDFEMFAAAMKIGFAIGKLKKIHGASQWHLLHKWLKMEWIYTVNIKMIFIRKWNQSYMNTLEFQK